MILQDIDLGYNSLDKTHLEAICDTLSTNPALTHVRLGMCGLRQSRIVCALARSLASPTGARVSLLDLSGNFINAQAMTILAGNLESFVTLKTLLVRLNNGKWRGCLALCEAVVTQASSCALELLDLRSNGLSRGEVVALGVIIGCVGNGSVQVWL